MGKQCAQADAEGRREGNGVAVRGGQGGAVGWPQTRHSFKSQAGEFGLEGVEKPLKNSAQGRGMGHFAFLESHSVSWVERNRVSGAGRRA